MIVFGQSRLEGQLIGPSAVFDGCTVAPTARVQRSVLGPGTIVGPGAVVVDSVLMEGCHVADDATVSGSIMGRRSTIGQRGDVRPVSVLGYGAVVSSGTVVDGERVEG